MKRSRVNRQRKSKKGLFIGLALFFTILLCVLIYGVHEYQAGQTPTQPGSDELVEVTIPEGASQATIAEILDEKDLIHSGLHFNLYTKLHGGDSHYQAGEYVLSPGMSLSEIVAALQQGYSGLETKLAEKIVFPEGITIEEMAAIVEKETEFSQDEFLKAVKDEKLLEELTAMYPGLLEEAAKNSEAKYKLEGYLFPATYDLHPGMTAADLVREMVIKTASIYTKYEDDIAASGQTVHEVITLASFIEKEGVTQEDREMISGVFQNRLAAGMPLQTDISVAYILDEHREHLSIEDVQTESPYNLYINVGLGPGPVNNPSESAWQAALNPTPSNYMYFLADLKTGKVYYAETYEEHLELKETYVDQLISESDSANE